jgi:hypothetical protein
VILIAIIIFGAYVRYTPMIKTGMAWLADLDPYRNLRSINLILKEGKIPESDPTLVTLDNTSKSEATSQGYYLLLSSLIILSNIPTVSLLAISPILCEVLLIVSLYALAYKITGSYISSLLSAFFAEIVQGWSAISMMGAVPLAENFGAILFPVTLILLQSYSDNHKKRYLILSGILLGTSLLIHPVTFLFLGLVLVTYIIIFFFMHRKILTLCYQLLLLVASASFALLIQFSQVNPITSTTGFSNGALFLFSLRPVIYVIDFNILWYEIGGLTLTLALIAISVIVFEQQTKFIIPLLWAGILLTVVLISQLSFNDSFLNLVILFPLYGPIILSHRVMPYLPPALALLSGICITELFLPICLELNSKFRSLFPNMTIRFDVTLLLLVLVLSIPQIESSMSYARDYGDWSIYAQRYESTFNWLRNNTKPNDVFAISDVGFGELVKTLTNRPVVFTISAEDISMPDLPNRSMMQSAIFINGYDDMLAKKLIKEYSVDYLIVIVDSLMIDVGTKTYVHQNKYIVDPYIDWLKGRFCLSLVYAMNDVYIFYVNTTRMLLL